MAKDIEKMTIKIKKRDDKIQQITKEMDRLHNGIREFQEQTSQIQSELLDKFKEFTDEREVLKSKNEQLEYDFKVYKQQ